MNRNEIAKLTSQAIVGFILVLSGCVTPAARAVQSGNVDILVADGKVIKLQGACYAIQCPDIQYTVSFYKVVTNISKLDVDYEKIDTARVCGASGLLLGNRYRFTVLPGKYYSKSYPTIPSRPLSPTDQSELACDFILKGYANL